MLKKHIGKNQSSVCKWLKMIILQLLENAIDAFISFRSVPGWVYSLYPFSALCSVGLMKVICLLYMSEASKGLAVIETSPEFHVQLHAPDLGTSRTTRGPHILQNDLESLLQTDTRVSSDLQTETRVSKILELRGGNFTRRE